MIRTRLLRRSELSTIMKWAADDKWHVSPNIVKSTFDIDPQGWTAAEVLNSKELVGAISISVLNPWTRFGGFFITNPDWRGMGVGSHLYTAHMNEFLTHNVAINAVEAKVKHYREHGFKIISFQIASYLGRPNRDKLQKTEIPGVAVKKYKATQSELYKLLAYDSEVHTIPRGAFVKQWTNCDVTTTYIAWDKYGGVLGYGCAQPIEGDKFKIGPVFADTPNIGRRLFNELFVSVPDGNVVCFDMPLVNKLSAEIARDHEMVEDLKCFRMYSKKFLDFELSKVFALTSLHIALV